MKMLIIAHIDAGSPLPQQYPELAKIASGNQPTILAGPTVSQALVEAALDADQFEGVHIIGHGDNMLLKVLDGYITIAWLIRRLGAQRNLRMCFFNSCDSVEMATQVHTELGCVAIAMRPNVKDEFGAVFASNFYGSVARGASFNDAFWEARGSTDTLFPLELHPLLLDGSNKSQKQFQASLEASVALITKQLYDTQVSLASSVGQVGILTDQLIGKKLFLNVERRVTYALIAISVAFLITMLTLIWHMIVGGG